MKIYERIKFRRKELGLSADDVAEALGVSRATVYRYESADIEKLPTQIVIPLSTVLRCSPSWLMGWENEVNSKPAAAVSNEEKYLLSLYRNLNPEGKQKLIERAEELRDLGYVKGDMEKMA